MVCFHPSQVNHRQLLHTVGPVCLFVCVYLGHVREERERARGGRKECGFVHRSLEEVEVAVDCEKRNLPRGNETNREKRRAEALSRGSVCGFVVELPADVIYLGRWTDHIMSLSRERTKLGQAINHGIVSHTEPITYLHSVQDQSPSLQWVI